MWTDLWCFISWITEYPPWLESTILDRDYFSSTHSIIWEEINSTDLETQFKLEGSDLQCFCINYEFQIFISAMNLHSNYCLKHESSAYISEHIKKYSETFFTIKSQSKLLIFLSLQYLNVRRLVFLLIDEDNGWKYILSFYIKINFKCINNKTICV